MILRSITWLKTHNSRLSVVRGLWSLNYWTIICVDIFNFWWPVCTLYKCTIQKKNIQIQDIFCFDLEYIELCLCNIIWNIFVISHAALSYHMIFCFRSLVHRVNETATRKREQVVLRKGCPKTARVKGRGRYKSFTAKTMLQTTFPGSTFHKFGLLLVLPWTWWTIWTMYNENENQE